MKLRSIIITTIGFLLLAAASIVRAQGESPGQHQLHTLGGPFIVYRTNIQEELKLSDEQKQKLQEKLPGYLQETAKVFEKGLAGKEMRSIRQKAYEEIWPFLKKALNAEQLKRFQQLELQHEGPAALLGRPEIANELNITDDQRKQFMGVVQDMRKQMEPLNEEAHSGGNRREILVKAKKIFADEEVKIEVILSDAQKKQWLEMYGKPFDVFDDNISAPATTSTTSASGTTYYVSKTGSDSKVGSEAQPCLTIAHAEALAKQPGDVIQISGISSTSDAINLTSNCQVIGDITLSGTASLRMTGAVLTVKGKIVLSDQAQLTVTNGGLTFPQTYESQYSMVLNNSAHLKLKNAILVTNGTSQHNFSMALHAKNASVVDFEASKKTKGSWLLGNFRDQSQLNVSSSKELPTETYPSDSCRISVTNSNFGALWLECASGSKGAINVPQLDAQGNFNLDFGNSPGFNYSVHLAASHARLGMNSHPNSSMTINGGGAAGARDAHMQVGYFVENNKAPVTIKGLSGGNDVTLHFTDQGRDLFFNHVNLDPFAWQVYVSRSNGFPVTFRDSKMNEIAALTDGLVNISNCVLLCGAAGAFGPGSKMNITDTDIWIHDIQARHGGQVSITNSLLHGNVISAVGPGSSISLSSGVVEKRNASSSTKKTFPNGIPATTADGVPLFNNQNPLGQSSHVVARDGGVVSGKAMEAE